MVWVRLEKVLLKEFYGSFVLIEYIFVDQALNLTASDIYSHYLSLSSMKIQLYLSFLQHLNNEQRQKEMIEVGYSDVLLLMTTSINNEQRQKRMIKAG